jgi:hypothetical protein
VLGRNLEAPPVILKRINIEHWSLVAPGRNELPRLGVSRWGLRVGRCSMDMDRKLRELVLLSVLACVGVGFASVLGEMMFALVFAAEAAWAGIEGAYLVGL